ncbi:MAG: hypothetical protein AAFX58_03050, partial [Pseudomonadota bacterium]
MIARFVLALVLGMPVVLPQANADPLGADEFERLDTAGLDLFYVARGADDAGYRHVVVDDAAVWHSAEPLYGSDAARRLRDGFAAAVVEALGEHGIAVSPVAKPSTLRLSVQLIDLKLHAAPGGIDAWSRRFVFDVEPGRLTLVARITDANTGEILAQLADLEKGALSYQPERDAA